RGSGGEDVDGRHPKDDAHAGAATRAPSPSDAPEGTPACRRGRGHHDLRSGDGAGSLDVPRTVALAGRHSARDRERRVSGRERTGSRGRRTRESGARSGTKMTEARTDPDLLYVGTYTEGTRSEGI